MSRSVLQLPTNTSTSSFVEVPSTNGFNIGDQVFNIAGSYDVPPDNGLTSGTFNLNALNQPTYNGVAGGVPTIYSVLGASRYPKSSAVLSNGNVVTVYYSKSTGGASQARFIINTPTGTSVVVATNLSATFTVDYGQIGVVALSGGGFVAYWNNAAGGTLNLVTYAIFSNTGTSVVAAQQDTGFGVLATSNNTISATALPNGGFVLATVNLTTPVCTYRAYGSTGTGTFAATSLATATGGAIIGIAARSDSSFCIAFNATTTSIRYAVISATNTSIVNTTFAVGTAATLGVSSVTCLSNDTFVIAYLNGNSTSAFRLLPSGNTLGADTRIPFPTLTYVGTYAVNVGVQSLSAGNFVYTCIDNLGIVNYAFYSSTGTAQAGFQQILGTSFSGTVGGRAFSNITPIELTSNVQFFFPNGDLITNDLCYEQVSFQVNKTTYVPVNTGTNIASAVISTSTFATSGLVKSFSTPNNAAYYAANTSTQTATYAQSVGSVAGTVVSNLTCISMDSCTLLNGTGFAIAYISNVSPYPSYISIYNTNGVLQRTITARTSSTSTVNNIKIATMSSGNIVFSTSVSNTILLSIFSPTTGATIATGGVISGAATPAATGAAYCFGITGLSNDRFAVAYTNAGGTIDTEAQVFNNSLTSLQTISNLINISGIGPNYSAACSGSLTGNGFWVSGFDSSAQQWSSVFLLEQGSSSWSVQPKTAVLSGVYISNAKIASNSNNVGFIMQANSALSISLRNVTSPNSVLAFNVATTNGVGGSSITAICATALGECIFTSTINGGTTVDVNVYSPGTSSIVNTTIYLPVNTLSQPQCTLTPLYGPFVVLSYLSSTNIPYFSIISTNQATYSTTVTAGVTVSNTTLATTPSNGYTFAGVATTSAAAGGTGQVQINGLAKLNNSYNASQANIAFDSTNLNTGGIRGTLTGLNVNMQGNS